MCLGPKAPLATWPAAEFIAERQQLLAPVAPRQPGPLAAKTEPGLVKAEPGLVKTEPGVGPSSSAPLPAQPSVGSRFLPTPSRSPGSAAMASDATRSSTARTSASLLFPPPPPPATRVLPPPPAPQPPLPGEASMEEGELPCSQGLGAAAGLPPGPGAQPPAPQGSRGSSGGAPDLEEGQGEGSGEGRKRRRGEHQQPASPSKRGRAMGGSSPQPLAYPSSSGGPGAPQHMPALLSAGI
jgi:hypothetical protein